MRVTNDINSLQDLFTNGAVNVLIDCVQLIGIIVILLLINWKLGLAVIVTVPIMFFDLDQAARSHPSRLARSAYEELAYQLSFE